MGIDLVDVRVIAELGVLQRNNGHPDHYR